MSMTNRRPPAPPKTPARIAFDDLSPLTPKPVGAKACEDDAIYICDKNFE